MVISRQISHLLLRLEPFVPLLSHAGLTIQGTILVLELGLHGFECVDSLTQLLVLNLQPVNASARIARSRHSRSADLPATCDGLEGGPPPPLPPSSPPEPEPVRLGGARGGPRGDRPGVGSGGGGGGAPPDADEGTAVGVVRSPVVPPFGCLLGVMLRFVDAKDPEGGFLGVPPDGVKGPNAAEVRVCAAGSGGGTLDALALSSYSLLRNTSCAIIMIAIFPQDNLKYNIFKISSKSNQILNNMAHHSADLVFHPQGNATIP